jgi:hypothetical protein
MVGDSPSILNCSLSRNGMSPNAVVGNACKNMLKGCSPDDMLSNFSELCDVASEDWNKTKGEDPPPKFTIDQMYKTQIVKASA